METIDKHDVYNEFETKTFLPSPFYPYKLSIKYKNAKTLSIMNEISPVISSYR